MTINRVAVIFDDSLRKETTGVYCRRALEQLVRAGDLTYVRHFLPAELERLSSADFDLFLNIDDGLQYEWPEHLRPSACWVIDTHLQFDWLKKKSLQFDYVFAAQRDGAAKLREHGITSSVWLPLACDPQIHGRQDVPSQFDVSFVGNLFPGPRVDLLQLIQREFFSTFVGQKYFEEMSRIYSASKCVFNRSIRNDINMRVFEGMAAGGLLVTNDLSENGQSELFQEGRHLVTYECAEELIDKLRFYLSHQALREKIATSGREEVQAKHTYLHRMRSILQSVSPRQVCSVPSVGAVKAGGSPQDRSYFSHARPEVLELVPASATDVLELGCGTGRLGESIKHRQQAHVVGVELDPVAATEATTRLDRVVVADLDNFDSEFGPETFDCIICADVLEHLVSPENLLLQARTWLQPNGSLIASIPNVRHHSVVRNLIQGNWTYESAGLLDNTHVRFFTLRDIKSLFDRSGFIVQEVRGVSLGDDAQRIREVSNSPNVNLGGGLVLEDVPSKEAEEFFVYQFLIIAKPASTVAALAPQEAPLPVRLEVIPSIRMNQTEPTTRVRIIRNYQYPDLLLQTPSGSGKWDEFQFTEEPITNPDYVIVLNEPSCGATISPSAERIWEIAQEPPIVEFHKYQKGTSKASKRYIQDETLAADQRVILAPGALPWHLNKTYDELLTLSVPTKTRNLSCIVSNKTCLPGHRDRLTFLNSIRESLECDLFGRGFTELADKFDGLSSYRYSLALENHIGPYYWTEKIADCFLAWTMPIYGGCTRILEFFPEESMVIVDVRDPEDALSRIRSAFRERRFEKNLVAIRHARDLVLHRYQLFAFLAEEIRLEHHLQTFSDQIEGTAS